MIAQNKEPRSFFDGVLGARLSPGKKIITGLRGTFSLRSRRSSICQHSRGLLKVVAAYRSVLHYISVVLTSYFIDSVNSIIVKIIREPVQAACFTRSEEDHVFFKTLFKQHAAGLLRLATSQLKSQAEAEEVVQECFLKFWEQGRELGSDLTAAKGYLYTSAYHAILNRLRRQQHWVYQDYTEETLTEFAPQSTALEYAELEHLYTAALAQLPPRRRQVFLMSRQQDLSYAAIAKELGVSIKAVEEHISLAMKFLRSYFRAQGIIVSLLLLLLEAVE